MGIARAGRGRAGALKQWLQAAALHGLWRLPPETAHRAVLAALRRNLVPSTPLPERPRLATTFLGRALPHPLGLAAGFDKDAVAVAALFRMGFAFVEVGTVTPRPQAGNPAPRLFRLPAHAALINRMGFPSEGLEALCRRLEALGALPGPLGVNIGTNRDAADPLADFVAGLEAVHDLADYLVVNVSSPNTPGLRRLQEPERLRRLLDELIEARARRARGRAPTPLLVKLAPDLDGHQEAGIADLAQDKGIDGLIIANTTISRPVSLRGRHRGEPGGLSGRPLLEPSTELLRRMYRLTSGRIPLIGVGGIASGEDAYAKLRAGASALQLYTALIYGGPAVIERVLAGLDRLLERDGFTRLADAVGVDA
jgi:dihydroorotate dehydrogenase